ncbi:hypothetical protein CSA37_07795 [Candidatus Fermentibacteria bacterium]|nr:MAG: hypothetical protein CSA37_07795 [Candidatus Fermentibacteria bacterium]
MYGIVISVLLAAATSFAQIPTELVSEDFISAPQASTQSELDQYTLVSVNSSDELEDLLSNGYPTPELQAVLENESIPQKDRYWLDCRMRSAIAQLLHRFYDEQGNPVEIEADWIRPGEDYWQETMMVNPVGEPTEISPDGPSFHFLVDSGFLYNLYGEEIGQLAAANDFARTSRDGSLTVVQTGRRGRGGGGEMNFCFMYPDGSFSEIEFQDQEILSDRNMTISQDGSISAWNIFTRRAFDDSQILVFDNKEREIERYDIPYMADWITISPDNRYVAVSLSQDGSCVIDRFTEEILQFPTGRGRYPFFSENCRFCLIPEGYLGSHTPLVNLQDGSFTLIPNRSATLAGRRGVGDGSISNDGRILLLSGQCYLNGISVFTLSDFTSNSISPNGYFAFYGDAVQDWILGIMDGFAFMNLGSLVSEVER